MNRAACGFSLRIQLSLTPGRLPAHINETEHLQHELCKHRLGQVNCCVVGLFIIKRVNAE